MKSILKTCRRSREPVYKVMVVNQDGNERFFRYLKTKQDYHTFIGAICRKWHQFDMTKNNKRTIIEVGPVIWIITPVEKQSKHV